MRAREGKEKAGLQQAQPRARRGALRERVCANDVIETACVMPLILLLVMGILAFGFSAWQRSSIDYELSHMAEDLPDDWAGKDADEVVRELILKDSFLDGSKLTVSNARVEESSETSTRANDAVSKRLGSSGSYTKETWVTVTADVEYDATGALALAGRIDYKRTVSGTYLVERRYEVF